MSVSLTVYVVTKDVERMRQFYQEALQVKPAAQQGAWLPFSLGGATFALHAAGSETADELQTYSLSFGVDDIDAVVSRFQSQGAKTLRGVADEAFGMMATLEDLDGRVFEVVQY